jgi:hypothetical protein
VSDRDTPGNTTVDASVDITVDAAGEAVDGR